ncbi:type II toxin-antitoxin system toxin DNA ADP-ribosyl transferase DarT [Gemmatimonas sp.]|uniref:type II toxin-antitoxin system toxin DNA ADP-ribosyl transferase DarT n=1 Tax=Gemmatimonas sp. TaxID=1962908 RepID=UPI003DA1FAAE
MSPSLKPLSEVLTLANALIFRITHRDNVPHILANGLHCQRSGVVNPAFVPIGSSDIIGKRASRTVDVAPGGLLVNYVPFYFTPCTPMLYNIVTGRNGVKQRARSEVVVLVSSFDTIEALDIPIVVADRNATLMSTTMKSGRELLGELPWDAWRSRNFRRDQNDPEPFERYQAEALVHRLLPPAGLLSIITYDAETQAAVNQAVSQAGLTLPTHVRSHWYP